MKVTISKSILACAIAASLCGVQSGFAFTATTTDTVESNAKGVGNTLPGAQIGDTFSAGPGSFSTYQPGTGDPTITLGDLGNYRFSLSGTVVSVSGNVVGYLGTYEIFYATTGNPVFSSGTLSLTVNFNGNNPYSATGVLTQTSGPDPSFPSTGFASPIADFTGTYNQTNAAGGFIQGTITSESVPEVTATLPLMGLVLAGAFVAKRRVLA